MTIIRYASFAGINNRDDPAAQAFQPPPEWDRTPIIYQTALHNGYVTNDRRIRAFPGSRVVAAGTLWGAGLETSMGLLVHDRGAGRVMLEQEVVVSGLGNAPIVWVEHQGMVYWGCGGARGRITQEGVNLPWGLPQAPTPDVTTTAGEMPPGRYLVSVTWIDSTGAESGCAPSAEVVLSEPGGLRVGVGAVPEGAKVRVYVSPPNGQHPEFVADVSPAALPFEVGGAGSMIPLRTQGLGPMPVGEGLTTRGGFLLTWADNVVWFSAGQWAHLCDLSRNLFVFPLKVLGAVGLDAGVWVVTERVAYWVDGADLSQARIVPVMAKRTYAAGGARMAAFGLGEVAIFASSDGPVAGTNDGQMLAPLAGSQVWDVSGKRADVVMCEYAGTKLVAVNLVGV